MRTVGLTLLLLVAGRAEATISYVGSARACVSSTNTLTLTYTATAGNTLLVGGDVSGSGISYSSISGNGGSTFSKLAAYVQSQNSARRVELWGTTVGTASADTSYTLTYSGNVDSSGSAAMIAEYAGVTAYGGIVFNDYGSVNDTDCLLVLPASLDANNWFVAFFTAESNCPTGAKYDTAVSGTERNDQYRLAIYDNTTATAGNSITDHAILNQGFRRHEIGIELRTASTGNTYTNTPTATRTATSTRTATRTDTATSSATHTISGTSTSSATHTATATVTATATGTASSTATASETATASATDTVTATETATATSTGTATSTSTVTATSTSTPSLTPTAPLLTVDDVSYGMTWSRMNAERLLELNRSGPFAHGVSAQTTVDLTPVAVWTATDRRIVRVVNAGSEPIEVSNGPFAPGQGECVDPTNEWVRTRWEGACGPIWICATVSTALVGLWAQPD